jgi:transcriptional regulator with XRE-family HTH domain
MDLERRAAELLSVPRAGRLARRLRKGLGMSLEQLGELLCVDPKHIDRAEKTDDLSCVADDAIMGEFMHGEDTAAEVAAAVDKYIAALAPSEEEEEALRYDLLGAMGQFVGDLREYCGAPLSEPSPISEPSPKETVTPALECLRP